MQLKQKISKANGRVSFRLNSRGAYILTHSGGMCVCCVCVCVYTEWCDKDKDAEPETETTRNQIAWP